MMRPKHRIRAFRRRIKQKLFLSSKRVFYTKDILGARYTIGDYTYGNPSVISLNEGTSLKIGRYCSIAANITIFLGAEHHTDWISTYPFPALWEEARSVSGHPFSKGDVVIKNDVWIGYNVTILSGVTIGDGAVIGAGSVVVKDVPPYAIVSGNPAQIVRYRFSEGAIRKLLQIRWWDWPDEKVKENVRLICSDSVDEFVKRFG